MNTSLHVPVTLGEKAIQVDTFINSGTQDEFIHPNLVIKLCAIPHKIPMIVGGRREMIKANIINTGKSKFMLGYSWLCKANPSIDWRTGEITFGLESPSLTIQQVQVATLAQKDEVLPSGKSRDDGQIATRPCGEGQITVAKTSNGVQEIGISMVAHKDELEGDLQEAMGEAVFSYLNDETPEPEERETSGDVYMARVSMATQLSAEADTKKKPQTIKEMVPEYLRDFYSVFDKGTAT
ncbi:hypothetical protein DAEQUDRAFT_770962 [Daedalea quercina L-15889]|uniref:Uncharacterized protein n=1 Tax=Daedalea quercina L-15889 TaxID=1314783 RepID=A0A165KFG9_9APHY|nr:hypothetical protein DAEQUDRAFT_770962 [Daedalea quercina L-15889]